MTDAAQLDAIGQHLLAGTWSQAIRRKLQLEWRWDDLRMDDAEGRMRRSLGVEASDLPGRERMRRHLYNLLEEARREAIGGNKTVGPAVSAIVKMGELYGCFPKADAKEPEQPMKTLADKRRVAKEARGALEALEQDIAAEENGRH